VHILHLIHQHRQMTINEFIEKYNSDNFDSYIKENATIDYWNDLIKTYKLERLKFVFPDAMQLTLNPLLQEGNDIFFGVAFDRFCERQIKILEIKQQYKPQEPENVIIEANEYVLFIVNSYFDAQESLGNEPDLINLVKDLFQQTVLRFGKKLETENFMTPYEFNSRIYFALNAMMQCGYNDDWETSNSTKFMRIETIVKDIKRPISRIEFKNIGDWIEELISINEPQQTNTIKTEIETKNILTNDTYYNILENCTIEAFESLKLKELYPKNGTKAIWDISSLTITKGDGLPTEKDNDLFRKEYILDNMRVTFLMALDRFSKSFENKHSITRDIFYKKCYQSILLKTSQSSLWQEPDFGFDIDKQPCKLTFIWNMRTNIEARSKETKQSKPQQNPPEQTNTNNTDEVKKSHPKHNPNDWNTDCFEFFKYLFDEYYNDKKRTNTKLMCIWFYLSEYNPEKYNLKITKDDYIVLIKKNYGIKITNRDKPDNYESKVLGTLHEHRIKFEVSLK